MFNVSIDDKRVFQKDANFSFTVPINRMIEKERLLWRANKYRDKEDRGGIAYILRAVKKGDTVMDIGAHKGGYLYFMQQQTGVTGKVYAFEPQSILYNYLARMKDLLNWSNVVIEPLAISGTEGNAVLYIPQNHGKPTSPGATIIPANKDMVIQKQENVVTITLDAYCRQYDRKPVFLKIDVEGNELPVFKGAEILLKRNKPRILFECEARYVGEDRVTETFAFLQQLGYNGHFILDDRLLPLSQFNIPDFQNPGKKIYCNNFLFE